MAEWLGLSRRELMLLAALFACTLPAVTPRVYASDEIQYVSYLRSLWFDRDVSFENEYRYFYERGVGGDGFHSTFLELSTEAGQRPNFGTIGSAILWSPFYAAADAWARFERSRVGDGNLDGFSYPYIAAVAYGSAFYGFLAVLLAVGAARRVAFAADPALTDTVSGQPGPTDAVSLTAGLLMWFGTPLLFYMYIAPPYAHANSAFAVALFVVIWLVARERWSTRGAIALGLSAALMTMVREQDVFFAIGPAVDFVITAARGRRYAEAMRVALAGVVAFLAGITPQLVAYASLNGHPGPSTLVTRKMIWWTPHALQVLFSPSHGFLFWTPLAVLAIAGLALLALSPTPDGRRVGRTALLMTAAQVYVSGSVDSWTVAGAFGQRRFVGLTILLVIGLATLLRQARAQGWVTPAVAVLAVCLWWNLALTALFGAGLMNRQRLELARNTYDAFVTIPRMAPDLARRYITTRESFFQRRDPAQ